MNKHFNNILVCFFVVIVICISNINVTNASVNRRMLNLIHQQPSTFEQFKLWHYALNKPYDINSQQGIKRYKIFESNVNMIKQHNTKDSSYKLGLGPFTDMTTQEINSMFIKKEILNNPNFNNEFKNIKSKIFDFNEDDLQEIVSNYNNNNNSEQNDIILEEDINNNDNNNSKIKRFLRSNESYTTVDWSILYKNAKDQDPIGLGCGSCWAFAAVGVVEGMANLANEKYLLSEQQLLDCDYMDAACDGGFLNFAMDYIIKNGLISQNSYPYSSQKNAFCRYNVGRAKPVIFIKDLNYCDLNIGSPCKDNEPIYYLMNGPYASYIEANETIHHYSDGHIEFVADNCKIINHAVIVVQLIDGYIFKIRNSWGKYWGQDGYGYIKNTNVPYSLKACGLLEYAYQPIGIYSLKNE